MHQDISRYNHDLAPEHAAVCDMLAKAIEGGLSGAEGRIWHGHPVWFLNDNPIVGYSKQKSGVRLMFWSGADFDEPRLGVLGKKFRDASIFYNDVADVNLTDVKRWLRKSRAIQWDYGNIVKRKGRLLRLR